LPLRNRNGLVVRFGIRHRDESTDERALSLLPQNNLLFAIHYGLTFTGIDDQPTAHILCRTLPED
jgi:hypothetical protein